MLLRATDRLFGRLPDFVCIGAQKAGTTWLHRQLSEHPEVFVPERKELDFFTRKRSILWYRGQFRPALRHQITGDLSPNYMPRIEPAEMVRLLPNAKVFCILRDPAERAFSQWKMAKFRGSIPESLTFMQAFERDLKFLKTRGFYADLIEKFEAPLPKGGRLAVFFFEDISNRPLGLLKEVFSFLGISENFIPAAVSSVVWVSPSSEIMSREDREQIIAYYRDDITRLEGRVDRDLSAWKE